MTRRIVVVRSGALGDVVLTLPAIQALRRDYPHASIEALGRPEIWRVAGSMVDAAARIEAPMFAGLFSGTLSPELKTWLKGVDLAIAWTVQDPRPVLEMAGIPHVVYACPYPPPGMHSTAWLLSTLPSERDEATPGEFPLTPQPPSPEVRERGDGGEVRSTGMLLSPLSATHWRGVTQACGGVPGWKGVGGEGAKLEPPFYRGGARGWT